MSLYHLKGAHPTAIISSRNKYRFGYAADPCAKPNTLKASLSVFVNCRAYMENIAKCNVI